MGAISGLAIHPAGDVIVTVNPATNAYLVNTVFGLHNNGPFSADGAGCATGGVRWCYGTAASDPGNQPLGAVKSAPVIGQESAPGAKDSRIYLSADGQRLVALDLNGARKWLSCEVAMSPPTPVVGTYTINSSPVELAVGTTKDNGGRLCSAYESSTGNATFHFSGAALAPFTVSSPIIDAYGTIYLANNSTVNGTTINADGTFAALSSYGSGASLLSGLAYDDSNPGNPSSLFLYAASMDGAATIKPLQQIAPGLPPTRGWASPDPNLGSAATGDPILTSTTVSRVPTLVHVPTAGGHLMQVTIADKTVATVHTFTGANPNTPLLASDNRLYLSLTDGSVQVVNVPGGSVQWSYQAGTSSTAAPTMDCAGHLYVGVDQAVYAFITDAQGLKDTPWPKFHRDSRNSGDANVTTLWGARTASGCAQ
jgi:hypothetical protein